MKNFTLIIIATFALSFSNVYGQPADQDKKPALIFVENGNGDTFNGQTYISSLRGAARNGNGNSNGAFGNIADWSVDMVVSEKSPEQAANDFGGFRDNQHPLYQGQDALTQNSTGLGALGWASFGANAYNRASGVGSAVFGFNNIAGRQDAESRGITGDDIGQGVFGYGSRATGNVSFATGRRSTAAGSMSVSMGNFNYATGDSTIALGKENWAEGASTIAIGFKNHAAGAGSVALGQENIAWGTTNFTSGYQNTAGDTTAAVGSGGSAVAMGKYNTASADASMALNRATSATQQAATSMGLGTTADNVGMLAIGVNNAAGLGDTSANYYKVDNNFTGAPIGVAFVIGNGDIDSSNGRAGANPSNAFMVKYDGSATLAGDLTVNSDARLKSNIISLGSTLAKLMQIDGKSYTMKSNEKENKIGLLAQEIIEVFPELVKEGDDKNGTMSVNYQGLIPVLINAIKEQQKQIDELKELLND
ncbi:MAG: tail fiber domain-containing protein [Flavobacteriaceae bacterium]